VSRRRFGDEGFHFEIPVTPMLDFTFQLLFFFMIYYNPSALEGQIDMALPAHHEPGQTEPNPNPVANEDVVPQIEAAFTVIVETQKGNECDGQIKRISVKEGNKRPDDMPWDEKNRGTDSLMDFLKEKRKLLDDKEQSVKIEAESRVKWSEVVSVMTACKRAGFEAGFIRPSDRGAPPKPGG